LCARFLKESLRISSKIGILKIANFDEFDFKNAKRFYSFVFNATFRLR